jgi:hypothetical protein
MLSIPLTPYHFNACYRTWSVHILSCHLRTSLSHLEAAFCSEGNGIVAKSCRREELPSHRAAIELPSKQSALESSFLMVTVFLEPFSSRKSCLHKTHLLCSLAQSKLVLRVEL